MSNLILICTFKNQKNPTQQWCDVIQCEMPPRPLHTFSEQQFMLRMLKHMSTEEVAALAGINVWVVLRDDDADDGAAADDRQWMPGYLRSRWGVYEFDRGGPWSEFKRRYVAVMRALV